MSTGINVQKINALRQELLDYAENVSAILNTIESEYEKVKNSIEGPSAEVISNKYLNISSCYEAIKANIVSYVTDLGNVVSAYDNQDQELSEIVISDANKMVEGS